MASSFPTTCTYNLTLYLHTNESLWLVRDRYCTYVVRLTAVLNSTCIQEPHTTKNSEDYPSPCIRVFLCFLLLPLFVLYIGSYNGNKDIGNKVPYIGTQIILLQGRIKVKIIQGTGSKRKLRPYSIRCIWRNHSNNSKHTLHTNCLILHSTWQNTFHSLKHSYTHYQTSSRQPNDQHQRDQHAIPRPTSCLVSHQDLQTPFEVKTQAKTLYLKMQRSSKSSQKPPMRLLLILNTSHQDFQEASEQTCKGQKFPLTKTHPEVLLQASGHWRQLVTH